MYLAMSRLQIVYAVECLLQHYTTLFLHGHVCMTSVVAVAFMYIMH